MNRTLIIWLLLLCGVSNIIMAQNGEVDIQKIKLLNCETDTCRSGLLYQIGRLYLTSNLDSAEYYCNQAILMAEKNHEKNNSFKGNLLLATIFQKKRQFDKCDSIYSVMKKQKIMDGTLQTYFYSGLGTYYQRQNLPDSALIYYNRALGAIDKADNTNLNFKLSIRSNIARIYKSKYQYQKALSSIFEIEEQLINEDKIDHKLLVGLCIDKGMIYKSMKDNKSAISLLEDAIQQYRDKQVGFDYFKLFSNLGNLYLIENDMVKLKSILDSIEVNQSKISKSTLRTFMDLSVDYYTEIEDYDLAEKENQLFKEFLLANNYKDRLYLYYNNQGKILLRLGKEALANKAFNKALKELDPNRKYSSLYADMLEYYLQTLPLIDDTHKIRFETYIEIRDSLVKDIVEEEVLKSREEYQTEKVNSENLFLKEENKLKERNIKLQRNGLIAMFLAVLGISYLLYRLKKQNARILIINNELDEKNTKIKLFSRETIHRTKNQIALIANLITNQKQLIGVLSPKELIEDIDSKVRALTEVNRSLDINEEDSSVEVGPLFKSILENNTYSLAEKEINVKIEGKAIKIDGNKVSNLALVINELSTNSIKYAFHEVEDPEISINTSVQQEDLIIEYKDNGKPFKNLSQTQGKGTELINGILHYMGGSNINSVTEDGYVSTIKIPKT